MKVNEIIISDDELLFDVLIDRMASDVKVMFDLIQASSDNFKVNVLDSFSPDLKSLLLEECLGLQIDAKTIYTNNQQTLKILDYLLTYLTDEQ